MAVADDERAVGRSHDDQMHAGGERLRFLRRQPCLQRGRFGQFGEAFIAAEAEIGHDSRVERHRRGRLDAQHLQRADAEAGGRQPIRIERRQIMAGTDDARTGIDLAAAGHDARRRDLSNRRRPVELDAHLRLQPGRELADSRSAIPRATRAGCRGSSRRFRAAGPERLRSPPSLDSRRQPSPISVRRNASATATASGRLARMVVPRWTISMPAFGATSAHTSRLRRARSPMSASALARHGHKAEIADRGADASRVALDDRDSSCPCERPQARSPARQFLRRRLPDRSFSCRLAAGRSGSSTGRYYSVVTDCWRKANRVRKTSA